MMHQHNFAPPPATDPLALGLKDIREAALEATGKADQAIAVGWAMRDSLDRLRHFCKFVGDRHGVDLTGAQHDLNLLDVFVRLQHDLAEAMLPLMEKAELCEDLLPPRV